MILLHGDCLGLMKEIPDKSIDMVLTDPPYGTTACKWDNVIPLEPMWEQLKRITKDNGAVVLFGSEPFSSFLRISNINMFKHDWIWHKSNPKGHLNAKKYPMKLHEKISVFSHKKPNYYPQFWESKPMNSVYSRGGNGSDSPYGEMNKIESAELNSTKRYPVDILKFNDLPGNARERVHPTQKPVDLLEYLIKTYTQENEIVLDFTMGSGSTGVACKNTNRQFIGIEKDDKYFEVAKNRIENHKTETKDA